MKKGKKITIIILIVSLIISGLSLLIYNFYKDYKEDKIKTEELIKNVNADYENFITKINNINSKRGKVYTEIFKETYYTDMQNNIDNWNTILNEYGNSVKELDSNFKYLKNNCVDIKFYHSDINPKCESFLQNYEMIINYYISDVIDYNNNIDSYNTWVNENQEESYKIIDKFVNNSYTEYIDFNNDGVFLGKE